VKGKLYRVWFAQVNQTYVDVTAKDVDDAIDKAARLWRRDWALPRATEIKALEETTNERTQP